MIINRLILLTRVAGQSFVRAGSTAVLLFAMTLPSMAQGARWQIHEKWTNHQIYDLDCGPGGLCAAAVTLEIELATIVRVSDDSGRTWRDVLTLDESRQPWPLRCATIQVVGLQTLVVGFDKGVVGVSDDAGGTWNFRRAYDTGRVVSLHMLDESRGIARVNVDYLKRSYVIVSTNDAWRTWRRLSIPDSLHFGDVTLSTAGPQVYPTDVAMLDDSTAVAVYRTAPKTVVIKTTNHGYTWQEQPLVGEDMQFVRFADSLNGWIYGGRLAREWDQSLPAVLRTTDGGEVWQLSLEGSRIHDLAFRGPLDVTAVASEQRSYSSSDGGMSWQRDSTQVLGAVDLMTAYPDTGDAIIATRHGTILLSTGVRSWTSPESRLSGTLRLSIDKIGGQVMIEHDGAPHKIRGELYDIRGRSIATLHAETISAGRSVVSLRQLDVVFGTYFLVVFIDGASAHTIRFVHGVTPGR